MSENKWYVYIDSAHTGPFSWSEIKNMHSTNKINEQTLVWREGQDDWLPLFEIDQSLGVKAHTTANLPPDLPPNLPSHILGEANALAVEDEVESRPPGIPFEQEVENIVGRIQEHIPEDPEILAPVQLTPSEHNLEKEKTGLEISHEELEQLDDEEKEFLTNWQQQDGPLSEDESFQENPFVEDQKLKELADVYRQQEEQAKAEQEQLREYEKNHSAVESSEFSEFEVDEKTIWSQRKKIVMGSIVALIILITAINVFSDKKMIPSLKALKTAEAKRLMMAVNSDLKIKVAVSPSEDGREIWFASNQKGPGIFHIKLTSINGRVMSDEEIEVVGKTEFNNYVGVFRFLKIKKGLKVEPGEYKMEGKMILTGRKARLYNYLKESSLFSSFVKDSETSFDIEKEVRISKYQGEQFETQLKEYYANRKLDKVRPLMERVQKFRTLITLAEDMIQLYKEEIEKVNVGKDIRSFEVRYSKEIGPLLQGLILENHKISVGLPDKESEEYADYANLLSFGRQLGEMASDMVTTTGVKPKVTAKTRARLITDFSREIDKLIKHGRDYMNSIQKRIEEIN